MKIKFTLRRPGGSSADLVAQVDGTATIGDLAGFLAAADPLGRDVDTGDWTLARDGDGYHFDRSSLVGESTLASGGVVSVVAGSNQYASSRQNEGAAVLKVLAGPDEGRSFELGSGSSVLGREDGCQVLLNDPQVSRKHLRINVGETVEVIDLGSANGSYVGGGPVSRATLRADNVVEVGDTSFTVTLRGKKQTPVAGHVDFIRPPVVRKRFEGKEFEGITAPERPTPQRVPIAALLAPLLMGGVLYAITKNPASLAFVLLSPMMLLGNALESRILGKRHFKQAIASYREDLAALMRDVDAAKDLERESRLEEHPATSICVSAVMDRTPWLWGRRPEVEEFGQLRLGIGELNSRSSVSPPQRNRAPYELVAEQLEIIEAAKLIAGVPVVGGLRDSAVGVAGTRPSMLGTARSLVIQALALHSPAELAVVGMFGSGEAPDWDWLKWTPHTSYGSSPIKVQPLASTPSGALILLAELEALIDLRRADKDLREPAVLVVVESTAPVEHSRLVQVAEHGPSLGIFVIWCAPETGQLPAACQVYVEVAATSQGGAAGYVTRGDLVSPIECEILDAEATARAARSLAPVNDAGARDDDDSDLPRSVSQLALLGPALGDQGAAVLERWLENGSVLTGSHAPAVLPKRPANLRAVLGQMASGPHVIDLRIDGPHALVGGTTGAGKSELLQSWITSMAATNSPERVTFLLVDYKGGSAFADCADLPHTIGLVTDLSPRLVQRALTSLSAELRYREELLKEHGAKDLVELEKHGVAGAPPSLVIVVDEFAALSKEVPEFVEGVVNVAQRGRSLGLHLVLATQRPAGAINDNLRANTNLRISLRMAVETDSVDVLGTDDAVFFDPGTPGRAMSKSGPNRLVSFQTAYAGGWTSSTPEPPEVVIDDLTLATPSRWRLRQEPPAVVRDRDRTDIKRLVANISAAAELAGLRPPRKAWLPELSAVYDIALLPTRRRDDDLTFAVADDPERQEQPPASFKPDRDGNLVVYGTGGTGKSTLLRSIAIAAGLASRGGPTQVYGIDFGNRGLSMLEDLPHVGSVIPGSDHERIVRVLTWLRQTIDERAIRYAARKAATITDYRSLAGMPEEPRILLLIDGMAAFRTAYDTNDRARYLDMLTGLASDGRQVGVHLVMASDQRNGLPTSLASAVPRRLVMRMASADDYSLLGVPIEMLTETSPPGRAIDRGQEIQVAVLGDKADALSQSEQILRLAAALREVGVKDAPPIRSLPESVRFGDLGSATSGHVMVGMAAETLAGISVPMSGGFIVTGPPGSGRSTAMRTLTEAARSSDPTAAFYYIGSRRSELANAAFWRGRAFTADEASDLATALAERIQAGEPGRVVVFVEDAGDLVMSVAELPLQQLFKACNAAGHWFVVEGEVSTLRTMSGYLALVKSSRKGLAIQPDQESGTGLFNTPFPRINRSEFPVGRAFLVGGGRANLVQIASTG